MDIPKHYDYNKTESEIYARWEKSGFFSPENCVSEGKTASNAPSFSIVLPPPNVTGVLHIGHAVGLATEDILVRFHRMRGLRTLWIPGTDHAAIATESKVEAMIQKKEGKSRHDLGKEEFLQRVNDFAKESHNTIVKQIKKMGASIDWSREAYTLDKERREAVAAAFKQLYELKLIYRGMRIVNWDPKGQTAVSDDEVVYKEENGMLYTFYYDKNFPIPIATTRPETKLGDTAVAVHPEDKRYKKYIGKKFKINFLDHPLEIKVVADKEIDPSFGTGAVGITPAHSFFDWEIAKKNDLPSKKIIDEFSKINLENSTYYGLKIKEARKLIIESLKEKKLLLKEECTKIRVARAERTNGIIEPLLLEQWFVDVSKKFSFPHDTLSFIKKNEEISLKEIMQRAIKSKEVSIIPNRFEKIYFHWIDNLRDWCISRQIWFGHRIPVYYRKQGKSKVKGQKSKVKGDNIYIGVEAPKEGEWEQDPDTLDTWFSSGLWTFSVLGWPQKTEDLEIYHPTSVLETAYDILFFWVARMILMSTALVGEVPFRYVYLRGIVRDEKGQKMSKSLGNSLDPVEIAEKYGTDALRMASIIGTAPGNDTRLSEEKIKAQKHFANKIWNASRFVLSVLPAEKEDLEAIIAGNISLTKHDQEWLDKLYSHIKEVTDDIENYRLYLAAEKIYHYFWHVFADIIIEDSKSHIYQGEKEERLSSLQSLYIQLLEQIKIIHPFMPFITEELWSLVPKDPQSEKLLMIEKWPYTAI